VLEMAEIGSGFPHELEVPVKGSLSVYWYSISLLLLWVQMKSRQMSVMRCTYFTECIFVYLFTKCIIRLLLNKEKNHCISRNKREHGT